MEYLLRGMPTSSEDDIKVLRAECQRLKIKFQEPDGKFLMKYWLNEDNMHQLDLSKVSVFENVIQDGKSVNLRRLVSKNPLKWDR